jgi:hypothetical protein
MKFFSFLALTSLAIGPTQARASHSELWGELRLIGGADGARRIFALSPRDHRLDAEWLPDFIHRYGTVEVWKDAARRFDMYVQYLERVRLTAEAWPSGVRVPGVRDQKPERDRIKGLFELIGLKVHDSSGRVSVEIDDSESALEHIEWLAAAGVDVRALVPRLNAGETVPISIGETILPLPLPAFWTSTVFKPAHAPIDDIIADRSWAFIYLGLLTLDDETLGFLADRPDLLQDLHSDAPTFAAFAAASFRVRQDRVALPGGPEAEPIWRSLVGRRANEPADFLRELVKRDGGWLAYFYEALASLDSVRQAAALGSHLPATLRASFVKETYSRFRTIDSTWNIDARPFRRPSLDPSLILAVLDFDGGLAGPGWLAPMLDRIVTDDDWRSKPDQSQRVVKDSSADVLWTIAWVYARPSESSARFRLLRFAQRLGKLDGSNMLDLDAALRCAWQMPALAFALERMGVTDVAVYAHAARAAHALATSDSVARVVPRLGRWQAALALLEQMQRRRRLPPDRLDALVSALADEAMASATGAAGTVADWILRRLLIALSPPGSSDLLTERDAIRALVRAPEASDVRFTWAGLTYIVDEAGPAERDVVALRLASPAPDLGRLMTASGLVDRLARGITSVEELRNWLNAFALERSTVEHLPFEAERVKTLVETFDRIVASLEKIKKPQDLSRAVRQAPAVGEIVDAVTDAVVPPLVYALAVTPLNRPAGIFADTWRQHSLLPLFGESAKQWQDMAWRFAASEPRTGGGTIIRGSFFGLDVMLAESRMPRRPPTEGASLDEPDLNVLIEALVLRGGVPSAAEVEATIAALDRGRATVQTWRVTPPSRELMQAALASAAVDPRRANAFLWTLAHDPDAARRALTVTELVRLGEGRVPDAWGVQMKAIDGCPCQKVLTPRSIDDWRGSWQKGLPAAMTFDLSLRLVEHVHHLGLPALLVDALRPAATLDWVTHMTPFTQDDWQALPGWPHDLSETRVQEYVMALVARGILVAPGSGSLQ